MVITAQNTKLKPGYKRTEVGVIPEDWEVDNLKRFWTVIDCKHLTAKFVESGIPLASIREVQSRFVDLENAKQTTQLYYLALIEGGRKPQSGDLIFSRNATVGEIAQVAEWHPPFAMGQDVCLLRKKHSGFSSDYLQAVIRSPMVLKQFANFMVGSTFKRVNVEQIQNLIVPMPLPEGQTAIATVLSDLDSLMEALDKLIAKKRDIKQATMQQLLTGKMRLPGFSGEWEVKKLGEITEVVMGQSPMGTSYNRDGNGYPLINGPTEFTDKHPIKIQWTNQPTKFCKKNDILLCVRGSSTGRINIANDDYCIGRGVAAIRAKTGVEARYITFQVNCALINILALTTGSTFPNIDGKSIRSIEVPLPSFSEQQAIADILTDMDAEIAALEQKRDKTRALKQGIMQELLTGKTRLI